MTIPTIPQRIVHLGVGNFHRAHQAWYTQRANELTGTNWRITGVSLRRPDMRDALKAQDFGYTLEIRDGVTTDYQRMDVIDDILVAREDPQAVIDAIADQATRIVSLTVTEKGYCLDPVSHALNRADLLIAAELNGAAPTSTIGLIVAGLAKRFTEDAAPITILSCDNLPDNGKVLRALIADYAASCSSCPDGLAAWIAANVRFPCSMVDRIVPSTTDDLRDRVRAATGEVDAWPVSTEGFSQWVLEDNFAGPTRAASRPFWDRVGVELTDDVRPFELRKLRMLNGAHSALAYAGIAAGKRYVHEAIADPDLEGFARALMMEAGETLPGSIQDSVAGYADALIARFANAALNHELRQIAMDGSLKIPVRILATLNERLARGLASPALERSLRAWMDFVITETAAGRPLDDPKADELAALCRSAGSDTAARAALLSKTAIFADFTHSHPEATTRLTT